MHRNSVPRRLLPDAVIHLGGVDDLVVDSPQVPQQIALDVEAFVAQLAHVRFFPVWVRLWISKEA
jgi:hypothetical protein